MARGNGFEREFRAEMDRQARQMPRFSPDNIFCYWFLQAYVFGTGVPGVEAHVCGASRDGGFDAIAVDDYSNVIHLVQAKYRHPFGKRDNGKDLFKLIADAKGAFTEVKPSGERLDISRFYRDRKDHHKNFAKFWRSRSNTSRARFAKSLEEVRAHIEGPSIR